MFKLMILTTTLLFLFIFASCNQKNNQEEETETKTITKVVPTPSGNGGSSSTSSSGGGSGNGNYVPTNSTCYGNQNDGVVRPGEDPALFSDLFYTNSPFKLPGEAPFFPGMTKADVSWMAGLSSGNLSYVENNVTFNHTNSRENPWPVGLELDTVAEVFRSDSILRVRFKIENEPVPQVHTDEACWNRAIQSQLPHTTVQFDVKLRNVICNNPAITTPTTTMAECGYTGSIPNVELSAPYGFFQIDPTQAGNCSNIIDISTPGLDYRDMSIGTGPGKTYIATTIHIDNVKTDGACLSVGGNSNTYCPVSTLSRGRCYSFNLQVVRDSTKDFQ